MEKEKLFQEYVNWRIAGDDGGNIDELILLHFHFRRMSRVDVEVFFADYFPKSDPKKEAKSIEEEIFGSKILRSKSSSAYEIHHDLLEEVNILQKDYVSRLEDLENDLKIGLALGESTAYENLYESEYVKIKQFILNNSGTRMDAQDVFQDGVVILLEKIKTPGFEFTCKVGTYLYSCCRNLWLKQLRKSNREINSDYYERNEVVTVDFPEEQEELDEKLAKLLSIISKSCLKLIRAFYYESKSWEKIADELGYTSVNSAKNQKYKCLKRIGACAMD